MSEQREKQLIFVYTVVALVALYYAITYWLPYLRHAVGLHLEKSQILQSVEGEIQNDNFDIKELAEYKSKSEKLKEDAPKKKRVISPGFILERNEGKPSTQPTVKPNKVEEDRKKRVSVNISPGFQLPPHTPTSVEAREVRATNSPSTTAARQPARINNTSNIQEQTINASPRYLASFAPGSVEAQLHAAMVQRADPFGIENLRFDPYQLQRESDEEMARRVQERELREQQDVEYQQALRRDQSAQLLQEEAKVPEILHQERIVSRRQELAELVQSEPENGTVDCITLQFRSRSYSNIVTASPLGPNMRIKRRFVSSQHTAADLLLYVESLELRPLLSPVSATCVLTLDFPTRVVSCDTNGDMTLVDLGINGDSVVWIKFDDE